MCRWCCPQKAAGRRRRTRSARPSNFSATRVSKVARSTFGFRTRLKPPGRGETRRLLVADVTGQGHEESRSASGYRRVRPVLPFERDVTSTLKLVVPTTVDLGLSVLPRRKNQKRKLVGIRTSSSLVNRNFTATGPNKFWVAHIAEHVTKKGTLHACVVVDLCSREAVGGAVGLGPETSLNDSALVTAHSRRQLVAGGNIHVGQRAQFTSWAFTQRVDHTGFSSAWPRLGIVTAMP